MTIAWESELPMGPKMVLLALCDNANDQGSCYPSIPMLATKCSMTERSVFNHLKGLEQIGALTRIQRAGRSTVYQLDTCKFCTPVDFSPLKQFHPTPETVSPQPLKQFHPTPETVSPITVNEPSIEPSREPKKKAKPSAMPCPEGVDAQVWSDFLAIRKAKSAPMTDTALRSIESEATKACMSLNEALAMCCARGWQGFRAAWVMQTSTSASAPRRIQPAPMETAARNAEARRILGFTQPTEDFDA